MMLVLTLLVRGGGAYEFTSKAELKAACEMWVTDQSTAQATYGHISTFGTGQITDMSYLFSPCASWITSSGCYTCPARSVATNVCIGDFNDDGLEDFVIGAYSYDKGSYTSEGAAFMYLGRGW